MTDWTTIIVTVLGVVTIESVFKVIDRIRYKKNDKKLRKNEVEKDNVDTDRQQIDLADIFLEKTQKWAEIIESGSTKMLEKMEEDKEARDEDWRQLKEDMEGVKSDVSIVKRMQSLQTEYMNGPFREFLREKGELSDEMTQGNEKTAKIARKRPVPRKRGWKPQE
jgi:hypothetical protein